MGKSWVGGVAAQEPHPYKAIARPSSAIRSARGLKRGVVENLKKLKNNFRSTTNDDSSRVLPYPTGISWIIVMGVDLADCPLPFTGMDE
jgi:hypothetical protein